MSTDLDAQQQAHSDAVERLTKLRDMAKNALSEAEISGVPGAQSVVNDQPPSQKSIYGTENYRQPAWADSAQQLHATALGYWSEVRPYRQAVDELWTRTLATVEHPVASDRWERVNPRGKKPRRYRGIEFASRPLSLDDLAWWRSRTVTLEGYFERRHGEDVHRTREEDVFLPLLAASLVIETLDDVLAELGLLAEAGGGDTNNPPPI